MYLRFVYTEGKVIYTERSRQAVGNTYTEHRVIPSGYLLRYRGYIRALRWGKEIPPG